MPEELQPADYIDRIVEKRKHVSSLCRRFNEQPDDVLASLTNYVRDTRRAITALGLSIDVDPQQSRTYARIRASIIEAFAKVNQRQPSGEKGMQFIDTMAMLLTLGFKAHGARQQRAETDAQAAGPAPPSPEAMELPLLPDSSTLPDAEDDRNKLVPDQQ